CGGAASRRSRHRGAMIDKAARSAPRMIEPGPATSCPCPCAFFLLLAIVVIVAQDRADGGRGGDDRTRPSASDVGPATAAPSRILTQIDMAPARPRLVRVELS